VDFAIAIVVLEVRSNDIDTLRPLVPLVRSALEALAPGKIIRIRS
jgi:hypothetical protein